MLLIRWDIVATLWFELTTIPNIKPSSRRKGLRIGKLRFVLGLADLLNSNLFRILVENVVDQCSQTDRNQYPATEDFQQTNMAQNICNCMQEINMKLKKITKSCRTKRRILNQISSCCIQYFRVSLYMRKAFEYTYIYIHATD